jgi:hypothetical protein
MTILKPAALASAALCLALALSIARRRLPWRCQPGCGAVLASNAVSETVVLAEASGACRACSSIPRAC